MFVHSLVCDLLTDLVVGSALFGVVPGCVSDSTIWNPRNFWLLCRHVLPDFLIGWNLLPWAEQTQYQLPKPERP